MKLYLDGEVVGENAFTGGLESNREAIVIGGSTRDNRDESGDLSKLKVAAPFDGHIDEVAFYGQALDGGEVRRVMRDGPRPLIDEAAAGRTIDGTDLYHGVERISFGDGTTAWVLGAGSESAPALDAAAIRALAGTGRLVVLGDETQALHLVGTWGKRGGETIGDAAFVRYSGGGTTVLVLSGVTVTADETLVDPIAYWSLNEACGRTVGDLAGTPQNGTFFGPHPDRNDPGPAVPFGAQTSANLHPSGKEFIGVAHDAAFEVADGTVQLWFDPRTTVGKQVLFAKDADGSGTGGHLEIRLDGERIEVRLQGAGATHLIRTDRLVTRGEWQHLAFTFGADGMKLYLDGVLVGTNAFTGGLQSNREAIVIGGSNRDDRGGFADLCRPRVMDPFNGHIDEVAFYGTALGAAQVAALASAGPLGVPGGGPLVDVTPPTPPAALPVIDWTANFAPFQFAGPLASPPPWVVDFVSALGQNAAERNPNGAIRLRI
jgi:hypothetical protein